MKKTKPDIAGLILALQQQLTFLEKKIDTFIGQQSSRPVNQPASQPRFDQPRHQGAPRQDNDYRQRVLHKAVCADCSKECEVPFKPSQDRPVYCKDCFSKRKGGGGAPFKERHESAPRHTESAHAGHFDKPHGGAKKKFYEKKKFFEKKRPGAKKRKSSRG